MASKTPAKPIAKKTKLVLAKGMGDKIAAKIPKPAAVEAKPEVRSLEMRLADVTDRSEMFAARVAALELALGRVLKHWPKGQGKLRKDIVERAKRVGKSLDKATPAVDRETWQKAVAALVAAIG